MKPFGVALLGYYGEGGYGLGLFDFQCSCSRSVISVKRVAL